ncbi:tRNA uridine-5-carboxymethylaminomethyl(34) synthesis GTPase MnmE [Anaerotruncus colihominis]|uniref:tRNA modification GTPase MnmE n=1 Tax=Anaerotruncus colihominis TaxID=169435 RepID=A0A845T3A2_9FIRM|nr:tRNA uridine-5-carboxymethylaminomethyl(34) synthesis GTPase MnmE [Anaerotruncus colihominis]MCR2026426.1 tRNA uridine-5-carboxymethylaminomethyl(34) synthesis GTPase MnmE [Anaerotruncus colihominis]NDO40587.1 tRNA uridine-5-carboxymethylaminomethyl(34) synthesis GTPase MnmE [Anaerotruncus colihominis]
MVEMDTIAAIATPLGTGGIGVVRISGPKALTTADRIVRLANGKRVSSLEGYTCAYGIAADREGPIDEVIVTVFRAPRSYTGEDVVELSAHGGVYLMDRLLNACCENGARPALAGEFTKRAFLNGKLDLTQAEAVIDLISARGGQAARAALSARGGALYRCVEKIVDRLTHFAAHLSAWIDYPEEEIEAVDSRTLHDALLESLRTLDSLAGSYETGRLVRDGIETVIVGRPNVGKSSLMNLMTGMKRSIVSDIPGTTRDLVSDTVLCGGFVFHLTDTAGIRRPDDPIEREGVALALEQVERAQLVLAVFDGSEPLTEDDRRVMKACRGLNALALINKADLAQVLNAEAFTSDFKRVLCISARGEDIPKPLTKALTEMVGLGAFDSSAAIVANTRQRAAVTEAAGELREAVEALESGVSYDAVAVCIERALDALLKLTGKRASQAVVDSVFSRFCVGK